MSTCSVIILNWNGAKMLRQYLPSVLEHTSGDGIEVIVADNGSTDESVELLSSFPSLNVLCFPQNYGFAEGYNRAIEGVGSEYVVLLNSDVEVTSDWLSPMLCYMDSHPDVWACQPIIRSWARKTHFEHAGAAGGEMDCLGYPYCRGRILNYVEADEGQYDTIESIFWASGACLVVRRDRYMQVGGLDAQFFAHMEEIDLCWRMLCRGGKIVVIPSSVVYHLGGGSLSYENPRKTYLNFRNNLLMLYKNLPNDKLLLVMLCRFFLDYAAALQMLVTGKPKNAWAAVRARWDFMQMRRTKHFKESRRINLKAAVTAYPKEISHRSILVDFYLRGMF